MQIEIWSIEHQLNFDAYNEFPIKETMDVHDISTFPLNYNHQHSNVIQIQYNSFETEDSWFDVGQNTYEGEFYKVSKSFNF